MNLPESDICFFSLMFPFSSDMRALPSYRLDDKPTAHPAARCRPANRRRGYWSLRNGGFSGITRRRIVATCVDCVVRADATVRRIDRKTDRAIVIPPQGEIACCSCLPQWSAGPVRRRTRGNRLYGNPMAGIARLVRRQAVPLPVSNRSRSRCRQVRRNVPACAVPGRRKKSSMCSTLPPETPVEHRGKRGCQTCMAPSVRRTHNRVRQATFRYDAIAMLASVGFAGFVTIAFAVSQYGQTVRARMMPGFLGVFGCVKPWSEGDAFGDGRSVESGVDEVDACSRSATGSSEDSTPMSCMSVPSGEKRAVAIHRQAVHDVQIHLSCHACG